MSLVQSACSFPASMVLHPLARRFIMSMRIALINIDTQQSFHHRNYWQEDEILPFSRRCWG